jgi:hypothetical protein
VKPRKAAVVIGGLAGLIALGFRVRPRLRMSTSPDADPPRASAVSLPDDLPTPVVRFYRTLGSEDARVPSIDTFVLWGRAWMRRAPLPRLPVTFWSAHRVGWSGRQRLAVTWFGLPLLRGMDDYIDGHGRMRIGRRQVEGPEIDQGENLFLWAELLFVPSVIASRADVRWEPVDENRAVLHVPFGAASDRLDVEFDPVTGRMSECRAMRYRTPGDPKVGWHIRYERWSRFPAGFFPGRISVRWADQSRPWFVLDVDGVAINVAVDADLAGPGGTLDTVGADGEGSRPCGSETS